MFYALKPQGDPVGEKHKQTELKGKSKINPVLGEAIPSMGDNCLLPVRKGGREMKNKHLVLSTGGEKLYVDTTNLKRMQQLRTIVCVIRYADDDAAA